jgi:LmbE family N-acetylglucosaminyl deacetylase
MRPSLFAATILLALAPLGAPAAEDAALPPLDAATSLLVVSPHPDDETLCCAGVIQRVIRAGGRASVVWITSGDGERSSLWLGGDWFNRAAKARALGAQRMAEARAASTLLGVPPAAQLFLGYPDGGLRPLLTDHRTAPYESAFTRVAAVPYPDARFPGHPYTGESLERDFLADSRAESARHASRPSRRGTAGDGRKRALRRAARAALLDRA